MSCRIKLPKSIMDENLIALRGILTAHNHLFELLLGAQLASSEDPIANLEKLRKVLDRHFRFDMKASGIESDAELSAVQTAALNHLNQILDAVRDQLSRAKEE